jgi:protein tyrosine phosphatase (PTP) superfamily phosphohydrolase (DUF442 family)
MNPKGLYSWILAAALAIAATSLAGCHTPHQCPILQGMSGWNIPSPLPPSGDTYKVIGYRDGIRFYVVQYNDKLYRAGDIRSAKGAEALKQLGIKTVITATPDDLQRSLAKQYDLKFVEIPFGWSDMTAGHLQQFLQAVDAGPSPICVCSRTGTLRAGILLAHYRVHREGWTVDKAIKEYYRLDANYWDSKHMVKVLKENALR